MKILFKILKQLFGWFLFAEACSWILNYVGLHVIRRTSESYELGWDFVLAGHIALVMAAGAFLVWYYLSIKGAR